MSSLAFWSAFAPGAAKGVGMAAQGYGMSQAGAQAGAAGTGAGGQTWIDRVLSEGSKDTQVPMQGAQAPDINDLLSPTQPPYRLPGGPQGTEQQGGISDFLARMRNKFQTANSGAAGGQDAQRQLAMRQLMLLSSIDAKKDVKREGRSLREIMNTPAVTFRYKGEGKNVPKRPGIIAETAPKSWRGGPGGHLIKAPAWMGAQHGAIQNLARRVNKLEGKG